MTIIGKISVIIPCYNSGRFLQQTLESLLWQTYPNWECILIDDGSTDNSREVYHLFEKKDHRFVYIHQKNSGPSVARNNGVAQATGEFIQFLDADDIFPKERFQKCVDLFQQNTLCDVVYTEFVTFNDQRNFSRTVPAKLPDGSNFRAFVLSHNRSFNAVIHEFLFRKEIIVKHKFDETLPIYCEDVECWIRIAASGAVFVYLNEVLALYRMAGDSLSSNEVNVHAAKLLIMEKYRNHPQLAGAEKEFELSYNYFRERLVIAYFMEKSFRAGWKLFRDQWGRSSVNGRIKMLVWGAAMLIMSKYRLAVVREFIVKNSSLQYGGWKQYSGWNPPEEIIDLVGTA